MGANRIYRHAKNPIHAKFQCTSRMIGSSTWPPLHKYFRRCNSSISSLNTRESTGSSLDSRESPILLTICALTNI